MADYSVKAKPEDIPWEFQAEFGEASEKERLAQLMAQQRAIIQRGMQPQMVSGHYIRANPMQHLADVLASYWQGKAAREGGAERTAVARRMARAEDQAVRDVAGRADVGGEMGPVDPMGAEAAAAASPWERARKLGEAMAKRREGINTAAKGNLTGEGSAMLATTGMAPKDARYYKPEEKWSDPYLAETTPGLPKQLVQKNVQTGELRQVNRAPSQSVTVAAPSPEKPYITKVQEGMAATDVAAYNSALMADEANQSLGRIKGFLAEGAKVTGGPLAQIEVFARNLAAEYGMPLDRAIDRNNARLTAEFTSRIASQVLSGGRGISNDDRKALEAAFPSFSTGLPAEQLPAFVAQLEAVNNAKIASWQRRYNSLRPEEQALYPNTFGPHRALPAGGGTGFQDPAKEQRYQEWKRQQGAR